MLFCQWQQPLLLPCRGTSAAAAWSSRDRILCAAAATHPCCLFSAAGCGATGRQSPSAACCTRMPARRFVRPSEPPSRWR
jgi:hypothetical protein